MLLPHTYQTRDFAPRAGGAPRTARSSPTSPAIKTPAATARLRPADVPGQADRRRRAARAGAAPRHVPDRRVPRRRGAKRGASPRRCKTSTSPSTRQRSARSPRRRSRKRKQAVDLVAGRAHRLGRPRHQGAGASHDRRAARRGARRRDRRVASDLRRRLAADGAPDRQLGPDRRAEAVRRARHLRRDSAPGRA